MEFLAALGGVGGGLQLRERHRVQVPGGLDLLGEHLADCPPCFERAEFQRKLKDIVRVKCHSQTPEHLVAKIRQAIRIEFGRSEPEPPGGDRVI